MTVLPELSPEDLARQLRARLEFEELVLGVTATLAGARSEDFDAAVTEALGRIGRSIGTGRAYVYEFTSDGEHFTATHEYCARGVPSALESFRHVPTRTFRWAFERIRAGLTFQAPNPEALPGEASAEAALMRSLGIHSILAVPLRTGGVVLGGIGFDWYEPNPGWTPSVVTLLEVAGEVLAGGLTRARVERDLRTTEERLESFVVSAREAVFCYEPEQPFPASLPLSEQADALLAARLVVCNESYAGLRGAHAPGDLIGRPWRNVSISNPELLHELIVRLLDAGLGMDGEDFAQPQRDGSERWVRARAQVIQEKGFVVRVWGILRDVTDERRAAAERVDLEAQLRQAQRMESVGLLAGGVAHDFNNLLVVILNYAQMARDGLRQDPSAAESALTHVLEAARRAADLTRGLLTFSRQRDGARESLEIDVLLGNLLGLLGRMIPESITLDFQPRAPRAHVLGDGPALEQLLVNLCLNAADAIGEIGRISIESEEVDFGQPGVPPRSWSGAGRFVRISVRDSGAGMTPQVRERIFEPFFTTKEPGRGTGLGLAVVYGVIQQHRGHIEVESEPGRGTVFRIYLPLSLKREDSYGAALDDAPRGGHETLLVAEDHELVRDVVRSMLESAGYRVVLAIDGAEAVERFEEAPDSFDLALLDAVMPNMSGRVVFERLRALRPELPILVASGYAGGVFPPGYFKGRDEFMLSKPYRRESLLRAIRRALDTTASTSAQSPQA